MPLLPAPPAVEGRALELTGERTVPGIAEENYWFRRHEVAYLEAAKWLGSARVLEAGCGEGYGADILRRADAVVTELDYDATTTAHVAARYPQSTPVRGDLQRLPFADGAFEAVVNLQVIEHLHDQPGFVRECARVVAPGGRLVISTPNRITFSPGRDTPLNPFHTRELSASELADLLAAEFEVDLALGVSHSPRLAARPTLVDELISTPPDRWAEDLRSLVVSITADDFVISPDGIDSSLDLLFVATQRP